MPNQKTNILLGITGGIAAYKSAELVRLLCGAGFNVHVVMTQSALKFIAPLTLQALSGNPVYTDLFDSQSEAAMDHISLARWANFIIISPASANIIAKLAHGMANDLLSTICLATTAKLILAPAMNQQMWQHQAVQENIALLQSRDVTILGPAHGGQACGEIGPGRLLEPQQIFNEISSLTTTKKLWLSANCRGFGIY